MPTVDLTDAELTVTAAIRRLIELDKFAPRVDRLRSTLAKFDQAAAAALRKPLTAKNATQQPSTPKGRPRAS